MCPLSKAPVALAPQSSGLLACFLLKNSSCSVCSAIKLLVSQKANGISESEDGEGFQLF